MGLVIVPSSHSTKYSVHALDTSVPEASLQRKPVKLQEGLSQVPEMTKLFM